MARDLALPNGLSTVTVPQGSGGVGYQVGDVVRVVEAGASGGTLQVTAIDGNTAVTQFNITSCGGGYSVGTATTTGGHGNGLQLTISAVAANAVPNAMTLGPDGNMWFTSGQNSGTPTPPSGVNNIFQVTPSGQFTAFPGVPGGSPNFITAGPDGNIWFTDYNNNAIGRLVLSSGAVTEFPTPTTNSLPWNIATGPAVIAVPVAPTNVTGSNPLGAPVIGWTASASTVIGYNVYRSTGQNGPFTLVNTSLVTSTTFTDLNAPVPPCGISFTYYYFVTAVGAGKAESVNSNETNVVVNNGGPC
jgi:hypothetical protein